MISICHPSYGRPEQARRCVQQWLDRMVTDTSIEWILSLNDNDPQFSNYMKVMDDTGLIVVADTFNGMVAASNAAASRSKGDILILVSDDMEAPQGWDKMLLADQWLNGANPVVLQVHDGIRSDIVTLPIMNRTAYNVLGYLYHPGYVSMFADNDLAETAKTHHLYRVSSIAGFQHNHWINGKAQKDATYQREGSTIAWQIGEKLFEQRKKEGFPL